MLRELEIAEQITRRESKAAEAMKKSRALELQSQVCVFPSHFSSSYLVDSSLHYICMYGVFRF